MTIAPKKPRVEGGEQRRPAQPPPRPSDANRSFEEVGSSSGVRRGRSGKGGGGTGAGKGVGAAGKAEEALVERNSEDEREVGVVDEESERVFGERLGKAGLVVKAMGEDGACLFRAVADQIYGDQDFHLTVRQLCMDYMEKNRDYFSQFVTEDWREYVRRKRAADAHGNHVEIQAMAELFSRPIQVYEASGAGVSGTGPVQPMNTFQCQGSPTDNPPIRVSYHGSVHYNSVVEPWGPATVGVGLGLPGLHPNNAQAQALRDAAALSEREGIEKAMLEDKLRATDCEATSSDITQQVARESYLEFMREQEEKMKKENAPCHSGSLAAASTTSSKRSPKPTTSGSRRRR